MTEQKAGKRILLVDDDQDLTSVLSRLFERAGYVVRCAADGDQGVRMAVEDPPDLVLIDFMMPVKSGFDACQDLRRIPARRDVPIIALTAFGRNIGEIHGLSGGEADLPIQDCLEKPVEPNVLLERVSHALLAKR